VPATTRYDLHSSQRVLARDRRICAAVKQPRRCSTIFNPISASMRIAFFAWVSQLTYSHVSPDIFLR
jgi:hypothetical protein